MELVGTVKRLLDERLDPKPDGYNVGFNAGAAAGQTVPHVHVHVIPRYSGDMPDPRGGVRHVIPEKGNYLAENTDGSEFSATTSATVDVTRPRRAAPENSLPSLFSLTTGPDRPLWPRLADRLPGASEIDLLASFVQTSGLDHVREGLFSAIAAGAKIRLLVGDYLGITSPDALKTLLGWIESVGAAFEARLAELEKLRGRPDSFHPKAWRIADSSGGIVVVGSSNLSRAALVSGVEWNLVGETSGSDALDHELIAAFDDLWQQATPLSVDVVERYAARATQNKEIGAWHEGSAECQALISGGVAFSPRPWQTVALASLARIREQGYSKALVAVATGLGKTWLAAFDVVAIANALGRLPRVLVIAHRAEILAQAEATLRSALAAAAQQAGWALRLLRDRRGAPRGGSELPPRLGPPQKHVHARPHGHARAHRRRGRGHALRRHPRRPGHDRRRDRGGVPRAVSVSGGSRTTSTSSGSHGGTAVLMRARYRNMKELRADTADHTLRIAFAFDPSRAAILLVGGDKRGRSQRPFYRQLIAKADMLYAEHLDKLKTTGKKRGGK
jgi:HKD family nuclease